MRSEAQSSEAHPSDGHTIQRRVFDDLTPAELYSLVQLRVDVFVVEQNCAYRELDDRDREPGARHHWIEIDGMPAAYLRLLVEPDGSWRIGRVVTRADARGRGLAASLIADALTLSGRPVRIDAQSHLIEWYARFGFVAVGLEFDEDGIPHRHMVLGEPPSGTDPLP